MQNICAIIQITIIDASIFEQSRTGNARRYDVSILHLTFHSSGVFSTAFFAPIRSDEKKILLKILR